MKLAKNNCFKIVVFIFFIIILFNSRSYSKDGINLLNSYMRCSVFWEVSIGTVKIGNQNNLFNVNVDDLEQGKKANDNRMFQLASDLNIQLGYVYNEISSIRTQHYNENQKVSQYYEYSKKHKNFCIDLLKS